MKSLTILLFAALSFSASAQISQNYPNLSEADYPLTMQLLGNTVSKSEWAKLAKLSWLGVFSSPEAASLAAVKLEGVKAASPGANPNKNDLRAIGIVDKTSPLVLIANSKLTAGAITAIYYDNQSCCEPEAETTIEYKGLSYRIYAKADSLIDPVEEGQAPQPTIINYRLYLDVAENDVVKTELLMARPTMINTVGSILFVGDLDEDGKLDFILDTTNDERLYAPTLYLSSPADKGSFLKVMAQVLLGSC